MGRKLLYLLIPIFLGCNKSYKYIEVVNDKDLFGNYEVIEKEPVIITAENDSVAYFKAFEKFTISKKVNNDMEEAYGQNYTVPIRFKLVNKSGKDIVTNAFYQNQDESEADIEKHILKLPNQIKEIQDNIEKEDMQNRNVDSTRYKELITHFDIKNDEFDPNGLIFYKPKGAPKYVNRNGIFCYIITDKNGKPISLRLSIQYYADDWLFYDKVQFSVDGKAYEYIPSSTKTDNGNGGKIWEWSDDLVGNNELEILKAISKSKEAKMKLLGTQYYKIKSITNQQRLDISRSLDLYSTLEGKEELTSI